MKTNEIIKELLVLHFGLDDPREMIIKKAVLCLEELDRENREIKDRFIAMCDHYIEDLEVLRSALKDNELLRRENEMLWCKHTPKAVQKDVIDSEYDIVKYRCPCCGNRLFKDKRFCENCGQALERKAETAEGRKIEEKELEDIINLNDRS